MVKIMKLNTSYIKLKIVTVKKA